MGVVGSWFVEEFLKFDELVEMYILAAMELHYEQLILACK